MLLPASLLLPAGADVVTQSGLHQLGPMLEHLDSSLFTVQFPAQASEGIRDLRPVPEGAALYELSCLFGEPKTLVSVFGVKGKSRGATPCFRGCFVRIGFCPTTMNTLNTLDPKAFPTLMLPRPWRATIIEAKMLGNEVPAADMVRPAIVWDT